MKKRIISLLLCLVLIVSLMPAAAAVNTSDSKTVTVRYASGHGVNTHDYAATFTYSDELFTKSGYTYRQDLAEMSLGARLRGVFQQGLRKGGSAGNEQPQLHLVCRAVRL